MLRKWTYHELATSGVIDVSGYFYYAQNAYARSDDILVRLQSALLGSGTVSWLSHASPNDPWKFSFDQLAVNQGDVLSFTFQRSAGFFPGSMLGGNVLITAVPELSEILMLTLGLGLLWFVRSRQGYRVMNGGACTGPASAGLVA